MAAAIFLQIAHMSPPAQIRISEELITWFNDRWHHQMGAIDGKDFSFICGLLQESRPKTIVEIGCASGLSTAVISSAVSQLGSASLHSFDLEQMFYADREKPVGYLMDEALPHPNVEVNIHTGAMSLDLETHVCEPIDFCFIDAAHQHPWPLIDTLAVLPFMKPGAIIVHHDLQMFQSSGHFATGPKVLMDQIHPRNLVRHWAVPSAPGAGKLKSRGIDGNVFALRIQDPYTKLGTRLSQGFCLGWDKGVGKRLPEDFVARYKAFLAQHYDPVVLKHFETGFARYMPPAPDNPGLLKKVSRRVLG
ncbi:class I SAM-dependent methyltransferase [Roseobacteraceae bacterium S113]